jgi:class 3 adenylate cyclase
MTARSLATILAADVVGYSRLMGMGEVATLSVKKVAAARPSWSSGRMSNL